MKDFFANLKGILFVILFALSPAIVLGIVCFILDYFGLLGAAISAYDIIRLIIVAYFGIGVIRILLGGK